MRAKYGLHQDGRTATISMPLYGYCCILQL